MTVVEDPARLCFKRFVFFPHLILGITTTTTTISIIITCTENSNEDLAEHGAALVIATVANGNFQGSLWQRGKREVRGKKCRLTLLAVLSRKPPNTT